MNVIMARNKGLDLLKLMALAAMTIDHLRYVLPERALELVFLGRWAFMLFAMVLAFNVCNALQTGRHATLRRYGVSLGFFALVSEIPYRLMVADSTNEMNVLPTLLLGMGLIVAVGAKKCAAWKVGVVAAMTLVLMGFEAVSPLKIQYGVPGVLLIGAMYGAFAQTGKAWACNAWMAAAMALIAAFGHAPIMMISAMVACGFGFSVLMMPQHALRAKVPRVGKWAYGYYPAHMLVIYGAKLMLGL